MNQTPDQLLDAITESMETIGADSLLIRAMETTTQAIVTGVLVKYRSGDLTTEDLWAALGALDQTDRLRARFRQKVQRSQQATRQLTGA